MADWPIAGEILRADPRFARGNAASRTEGALFFGKRPACTLKYRRERNGAEGEL
jgi:hypothetical protein